MSGTACCIFQTERKKKTKFFFYGMQTASAEAIRRGFDDVYGPALIAVHCAKPREHRYSKLVSKRRQHEQPVMFKAATVTDQLPLQSPPTSPFRSPGGGVRSSPVTPIADVKSTGVSAAIHSSPAGAVVQQQQHVEIAEEHTTLDSSPVPLMPLPVPSATTAARRERLSLKRPTPAQPPATQKSDKTVTEAKRAVVDPPSPSKQKQQPPEQPGVQWMSELQSRPRRTSAAIAIVSLNELYGRETMTAPGAKTSTLTPPSLAESPPPQPPPQPPQLQSHQATKAAKGSGSVAAKKSVAVAKAPTSQRKSSAKQAFPASKEEVKNEVLVARRRRSALYIKNQKFAEHVRCFFFLFLNFALHFIQ